MALSYKIDWIRSLVIISGDYSTATEWLMVLGQLRRDPHFRPRSKILRDVRGASHPPTSAMIGAIVNVINRFTRDYAVARWAILADETDDAVAQTIRSLGAQNGVEIETFTSMDQAVDWLEGAP
jgi:hypothetical protein